MLKVNYVEHKTATITEHEAAKLAIEIILKSVEMPCDAYIKDDMLMVEVEQHCGSHSYSEELPIRKATDYDLAAFKMIESIRKFGKLT